MKTPEHDRLLEDILGDYPAFRGKLQARLHRQIRRQRFRRQAGYFALAASVMLLAVTALRVPEPPASTPSSTGSSVPAYYVRTQSLDPAARITTVAPHLTRIRSGRPPEHLRTTIHGRSIARISDEELFSLFPGTPVALIAEEGGPSRLMFLDADGARILEPTR